jgi:hypothetical protein
MGETFYRNAYRLIKQKHKCKAFKNLEGGKIIGGYIIRRIKTSNNKSKNKDVVY